MKKRYAIILTIVATLIFLRVVGAEGLIDSCVRCDQYGSLKDKCLDNLREMEKMELKKIEDRKYSCGERWAKYYSIPEKNKGFIVKPDCLEPSSYSFHESYQIKEPCPDRHMTVPESELTDWLDKGWKFIFTYEKVEKETMIPGKLYTLPLGWTRSTIAIIQKRICKGGKP